MIASDTVHAHQARCAPHMARLWMLAGGPGGAPLRPCAVQQVIEATDAILAEVRAAGSDMLPATDRGAAGSVPPSRGGPRSAPRGAPGSVPPQRGAPGSVPPQRGAPGRVPLLATRLTRLENAALQMIDSARSGDAAALREQIARFDVLTSAMWTVQLSECAVAGTRQPVHDGGPMDRWAHR
jgi:hypothetical protein